MLTCFKIARVGWLGSMNHWPQKASSPEEKVDTFAFRCYCQYQNLLEIPGSEVPENCLASFVADNPRIRLSILVLVSWDRFTGNHSRALRRKWQEGMQLGFWGGCLMVYRQISVKLWDSRPALIGLSDLSWDSRSGDLKRVVLHSLCVTVVGSAQTALQLHAHVGLCKTTPGPFSPGFGELLMAIYEPWQA